MRSLRSLAKRFLILGGCALGLLPAAAAQADDWPQWLGPKRDGVWRGNDMGDLLCLDAQTGQKIWSRNFPKDYGAAVPVWGFAGHPLLDGDRLICLVGGPGSVVVAFDKDTGKEIWKALSAKEPGYAPPMIF